MDFIVSYAEFYPEDSGAHNFFFQNGTNLKLREIGIPMSLLLSEVRAKFGLHLQGKVDF